MRANRAPLHAADLVFAPLPRGIAKGFSSVKAVLVMASRNT